MLVVALAGLLAFAGVFAEGVLGAGASTSKSSRVSGSLGALPAGVHVVRELSALRSARSDTYLLSDGTREARVFAHAVNYRDQAGQWIAIDDTLQEASDGSFHPASSPVPVTLPASLASGPITVGSGEAALSFSLRGASAGQVSGAGAKRTYASVMPGLSASYTATSDAVRELLTLEGPSAPSVYTYSLSYGAGVHASLTDQGTVVFRDSSGRLLYTIARPFVSDSSGGGLPSGVPVRYELSADGKTLTLTIERSWLGAAGRRFPVKVDPEVYFGAVSDCTISSGQPTTSLCGQPLYVGAESEGGGSLDRTLVRYELEEVPRDSVILSSDMQLGFAETSTQSSLEVEALALTRGFTDGATWNSYDGTNPWSAPGGDFEAPFAGRQLLLPEWADGWVSFGMSPLIERWVQEPSSNHGVLLKAQDEGTAGYDTFYQTGNEEGRDEPDIDVIYSPRLGEQEEDMITGAELSNGAEASIDVANGNLLLESPDVEYSGEGYETLLYRYYNSQDEDMVGSSFGVGWLLGEGEDTLLYPAWWDGSNVFHAPGGTYERFDPTPPATADQEPSELTYAPPLGVEATLEVNEDETRKLTFGETGAEWLFDESGNGFLQQIVEHEGAGNTISLEYESSAISHLEDSHGDALTISHNPSDDDEITKIEGTGARTWSYGYDEEGELSSYEDPEGHRTSYSYGANGVLHVIEDQSGTYVISYDESEDAPRVTSLRRIVNGTIEAPGSEDEITSFEYIAPQSPTCNPETDYGETIVRYEPEGEEATETYCYNASGMVTEWAGPEFEAEEEGEGTEEVPEVPAETCYEDPEFPPEPGYCGEYNPSPSVEEELEEGVGTPLAPALSEPLAATAYLPAKHYGIADYNALGTFNIFLNPRFKELHVVTVHRVVSWNVAYEGGNRLEELTEWVKEVKKLTNGKGEEVGEPLVSFETPTWYECGGNFEPNTKELYWRSPINGEKVPCTVKEEEKLRSEGLPSKARVPTVAEYKKAIEDFREDPKLSEVKLFTATNEPNEDKSSATEEGVKVNDEGDITNKPSGQRAGKYWRAFDKLCEPTGEEVKKAEEKEEPPPPPKCLVGAGDFTDVHMKNANNGTGNGHRYFEAYQKHMGAPQKVAFWAWHAYADGQEIGNDPELWRHPANWWHRFKQYLKAVDRVTRNHPTIWGGPPHIWLTEQGVVFHYGGAKKPTKAGKNPEAARHIMRAYVEHGEYQLTHQSSQIKRFYYYQMRGACSCENTRTHEYEKQWDSGLLFPPKHNNTENSGENPPPRKELYRIYRSKTSG